MNALWLAVVLPLAYGVHRYVTCLLHNIAQAKKSGLPYVVVPWNPLGRPWQFTCKFLIPILNRLPPRKWWQMRMDIMEPDFSHRTRMKWYNHFGEAFLIVAPDGTFMHICNAEGHNYMTSRREQFPKWVEIYNMLQIFGQNVVSAEGFEWRHHRRLMAGSFNEQNAGLVFKESVRQAQGMLSQWAGTSRAAEVRLTRLPKDTMKLALHVIGYVGFGLRLLWPGQTMPQGSDSKAAKFGSLNAPKGFTMPFIEAVTLVLENIFFVLCLPTWLLRALPFERTKRAADATDDYFRYINEMLDERIEAAEKLSKGTANDVEGMDLMGHLARESRGKSGLTRDEIVGNTFVLQVAGHETTANTLHFSCVYLACYPEAQRKMQRQIDIMFGGSDPATWHYNKHINALLASTVGAVMYETLRLIPSVPEIPKTTLEDQPITMDGVEYIVPKGTVISLGALSAQINPRYWPTQSSKRREGEDDMLDFVPDRWYRPSLTEEFSDDDDDDGEKTDSEEYRDEAGPTTSSALYRPIRGSYIPFSDGPRSCLGRRFAQTEVVATLAVIFREYSMELEVDHLASDSEVEQMPTKDRETVYHKAREQCLSTLDGARTMISLRLINGEKVPIRLVKRGQERFVDRVEY